MSKSNTIITEYEYAPHTEIMHAYYDTFGAYPPNHKIIEFIGRLNESGWMLVPVSDYLKIKKQLDHGTTTDKKV